MHESLVKLSAEKPQSACNMKVVRSGKGHRCCIFLLILTMGVVHEQRKYIILLIYLQLKATDLLQLKAFGISLFTT